MSTHNDFFVVADLPSVLHKLAAEIFLSVVEAHGATEAVLEHEKKRNLFMLKGIPTHTKLKIEADYSKIVTDLANDTVTRYYQELDKILNPPKNPRR